MLDKIFGKKPTTTKEIENRWQIKTLSEHEEKYWKYNEDMKARQLQHIPVKKFNNPLLRLYRDLIYKKDRTALETILLALGITFLLLLIVPILSYLFYFLFG
tara:strand:- start:976 stop:1281 length:306 start_codon:yes stop_codon:yes gene_type:complete